MKTITPKTSYFMSKTKPVALDKTVTAKQTDAPAGTTHHRYHFATHIRNSKYETGIFVLFFLLFGLVLHHYYPYTDMTSDTGGYAHWGAADMYGAPRPLGYSTFLRVLHHISVSTGIVFLTQYILYFVSQLFFYLSITYLFRITARQVRYAFLAITLLSFGGLYTTNLAMSENLFLSLSVTMVTCCIWLVYYPTLWMYVGVLVTLMAAISVRYIALVYPVFIFAALYAALSRRKIYLAAGVLVIGLCIYGYIEKVRSGTEKEQLTRIFTAFGGWQKASNTLHIIPHLDLSQPLVESYDADIQMIDNNVRETYPGLKHRYPDAAHVSYDFMWADSLPLRKTFFQKRYANPHMKYYHIWNHMGGVYNEYGNLLINNYPAAFFRYYVLVNLKRTLLPDNEIFDRFQHTGNYGYVERIWFNLPQGQDISPRKDFLRPVLRNLSPLFTLLWVVFAINILLCVLIVKNKMSHYRSREMIVGYLLTLFVVMYFMATVYAAPTNVRFLLPLKPVIMAQAFLYLHILYVAIRKKKSEAAG